jgi:hypothetical protein
VAGWNQRQQQNVHRIGHHDKRTKLVVAKFDASLQGIHNQARNGLLAKIHRTAVRPVQLAINPDKGVASRAFVRRRVMTGKEAAVQVPGNE